MLLLKAEFYLDDLQQELVVSLTVAGAILVRAMVSRPANYRPLTIRTSFCSSTCRPSFDLFFAPTGASGRYSWRAV